MRFIDIEEFKTRELHNGEKYLLVFDIGSPLTVRDRQGIVNEITSETNRFQINDEWIDANHKYYMEIEIINNLIVGLAVILVLSSVVIYVIGYSLSNVLSEVGVVETKTIPLAIIGLLGILAVAGYKWLTTKK